MRTEKQRKILAKLLDHLGWNARQLVDTCQQKFECGPDDLTEEEAHILIMEMLGQLPVLHVDPGLMCPHARPAGALCPHCMGQPVGEVTAPPGMPCKACGAEVQMLMDGYCQRCFGKRTA